ncbi:hypothetical protein BaRGS_00003227 [Batillaria attramentaria]|uniref:Uncharacterized protein n=1 Tax=Batillaria attramentaria TaxID=370345 RepID=A0ABD0M2Q2_9CAEN
MWKTRAVFVTVLIGLQGIGVPVPDTAQMDLVYSNATVCAQSPVCDACLVYILCPGKGFKVCSTSKQHYVSVYCKQHFNDSSSQLPLLVILPFASVLVW